MSIDVLLPTRGRLESCVESVAVILATAAHPEALTVYVRADDDDPTPYEDAFTSTAVHVSRGPRYGYVGLHRYYNELAAASTGDWLLVWNDDAVMQTQGWDAMLPATQALTVIGKADGGFGFPCFPRSWARAAGCVSWSYLVDVFLYQTATALGCAQILPWDVSHQTPTDAVSAEGRAAMHANGWNGEALVEAMVERLRPFV